MARWGTTGVASPVEGRPACMWAHGARLARKALDSPRGRRVWCGTSSCWMASTPCKERMGPISIRCPRRRGGALLSPPAPARSTLKAATPPWVGRLCARRVRERQRANEPADRATGEQAEGRRSSRHPDEVANQRALDLLSPLGLGLARPDLEPIDQARRRKEHRVVSFRSGDEGTEFPGGVEPRRS